MIALPHSTSSHDDGSKLVDEFAWRSAERAMVRDVLPQFDSDGERRAKHHTDDPWVGLMEDQQLALYAAALERLPALHRIAVGCDAIGGVAQLAVILKCSVHEAKSIVHEARQALLGVAAELRARMNTPPCPVH